MRYGRREFAHSRNIIWIGGSPGGGKTTVAKTLGKVYEAQVYHCDEHYKEHVALADDIRHPTVKKLAVMSENEFWMRPVQQQYEEAIRFYTEEFDIMLDNIEYMLNDNELAIIEGTILMPQLLHRINVPKTNVLCLVPTAEFQRKQHLLRGEWVRDILQQCKEPEKALENWMQRDELFAQFIVESCLFNCIPCFVTDVLSNKVAMFDKVEKHFVKNNVLPLGR